MEHAKISMLTLETVGFFKYVNLNVKYKLREAAGNFLSNKIDFSQHL